MALSRSFLEDIWNEGVERRVYAHSHECELDEGLGQTQSGPARESKKES